jgi:tRNA pseudouridine55 synthase
MRINGLLIVDKPEGMTSLGVVKEVKYQFKIEKAGHIGTLDPFATGVLPIVMNEGTKLVPFLEENPKEYEATLKLGEETATDDPEGEVISQKSWERVTSEQIHSAFESFLGKIRQTPPMFSAKKVCGKPLYRLARKGMEVDREEKEVEIFDLQIKDLDPPHVAFKVSCSRGTYIRVLARDIGRKIGCGAHLFKLRRIRSGSFLLSHAVPWHELKKISGGEALAPWLISLKEALSGWPEVVGNDCLVKKIRFGQEMRVRDFLSEDLRSFEKGQWLKMTSPEEELVAILRSEIRGSEIYRADPEKVAFQTVRVFNPYS